MPSCCSSLLRVLEMCVTKLLSAAAGTFSAWAVLLKVLLKRQVKWHFHNGVFSVLLLDLCICILTVHMVQTVCNVYSTCWLTFALTELYN